VETGLAQCMEAEQKHTKNEDILVSLADVIHKTKRNTSGNSEKVVHPCVNSPRKEQL